MQTGEYYATCAQKSTDEMHDIAAKTERETVSMHVITMFTLIFLPGTFVAVRYGVPFLKNLVSSHLTQRQTIFSSGILAFADGNNASLGPNLGDWKIRWQALKLFFIVCIPVMALTLSAWLISYLYARRQRRSPEFSQPSKVYR